MAKRWMMVAVVMACGVGAAVAQDGDAKATAGQTARSAVFDVRRFGAVGDGKTIDTPAINKAIEAANSAGGGTVMFPGGNYLSVSIHLRSNVTLYLDQGAVIVAAQPDVEHGARYDEAEPNEWDYYQDFGHCHWHNSLIWGENLENVAIMGPGMIWGKGLVRSGSQSRRSGRDGIATNSGEEKTANTKATVREKGPFGYPSTGDAVEPGWGNKAIALKLCRNVIIRDVRILHGGHFAILATGVDNFTCDNLKIDTNRDGIDFDCCRNVRVSNCSVNSPFDDGICPKASYALGEVRPTENVTITNCQVSGFDEGTFLDGTYKRAYTKYSATSGPTGRIKLGTESAGGFKNITISNCVFNYCRGLCLEEVDGAPLEDITINNITMRDVTNSPIFIRLGSRNRAPEGTKTGTLKRIMISNVVAYNASPRLSCIISGIPEHPIEDLTIKGVRIYYRGGGTKEQAATRPAEKETAYPEPSMFGDMPAYGMFIRHVKNLVLDDVHVTTEQPDARPGFVMEDVAGAEIRRVRAKTEEGADRAVLRNVADLSVKDCPGVEDMKKERVEEGNF